jgi:small-conductance mechanosensitive channel
MNNNQVKFSEIPLEHQNIISNICLPNDITLLNKIKNDDCDLTTAIDLVTKSIKNQIDLLQQHLSQSKKIMHTISEINSIKSIEKRKGLVNERNQLYIQKQKLKRMEIKL